MFFGVLGRVVSFVRYFYEVSKYMVGIRNLER